jgi:hypothetical protein
MPTLALHGGEIAIDLAAIVIQVAIAAGGVVTAALVLAWRWSGHVRRLMLIAESWEEVEYELRVNGMRRERFNEEESYRNRSLRDLVVELHERLARMEDQVEKLAKDKKP